MELRPADLGDAWHIAFVRLRSDLKPNETPVSPEVAGPPGFWGRRWIRSLRLSPHVAAETMPLTAKKTGAVTAGVAATSFGVLLMLLGAAVAGQSPEAAGGVAAVIGSTSWVAWDFLPRKLLRSIHYRPISAQETSRLRAQIAQAQRGSVPGMSGAFDLGSFLTEHLPNLLFGGRMAPGAVEPPQARLEEDFLALVEDAVRLNVASPEAEARLRETIQMLGDAVARLPLPPGASGMPDDAADLLADADMLVARARGESDSVIADSLLRQAEAKAAQASALDRALRLGRRTRILREELCAQIAAARAALPTLAIHAGGLPASPGSALLRVADSVQAVSREAAAVWEAHEELAAALGEPRLPGDDRVQAAAAPATWSPPKTAASEEPLRLRHGGG